MENCVICTSGGLDSTAAAIWASKKYRNVATFTARYGQPNADNELPRVGPLREFIGKAIEFRVQISDALPRSGLSAGHVGGVSSFGTSVASVFNRNMVLISSAAAHAASIWQDFDVVVGCNADDARRFTDCRQEFFDAAGRAISLSLGVNVRVIAPWASMSKRQVIGQSWTKDESDLLSRTWSCYVKNGPCGACDACLLRAEAFYGSGIIDASAPTVLVGGDPARDAQFKK